jgi:hypothetical protein
MKVVHALTLGLAITSVVVSTEAAITVSVTGQVSSVVGNADSGFNVGDALGFSFSPIPGHDSALGSGDGTTFYSYGVDGLGFALNEGTSSALFGSGTGGSLLLGDNSAFETLGLQFSGESISAMRYEGYQVVDFKMSLVSVNPDGAGAITPPSSVVSELFALNNWDLSGVSISFQRDTPSAYFSVQYDINSMTVDGGFTAIPEPGFLGFVLGLGFVGFVALRRKR